MDNLTWLQDWYANQSIENIGKDIFVVVKTIQNSAWYVEIDLQYTKYKNFRCKRQESKISAYNWFSYEISNKRFLASGDFNKLVFLLGKFRDLIDEPNKTLIHTDQFLDEELQAFLLENEKDSYVFIHYALNRAIAQNIIEKGFEFASPFDRSAKEIKSEAEYIKFTHYVLKSFGEFVIVICIDKGVYESYVERIKDTSLLHTNVEELFTELPVFLNENSEEVFTLHKNYIKGYFNYKTKELVENPVFNSSYDSTIFLKNLEKYKSI